MNENDMALTNSLLASLEHVKWCGPVIIEVSQIHIMKMQLILLKGLLEERGMRGLFLSVDRPHQYLEHLARMHKINIGGMAFMDIICPYSGDCKQGSKIGLLAGPYNINNLSGAFHAWEHMVGDSLVDPKRGGFVLIDNPAALLHYNSRQRVESFLSCMHHEFDDKMTILMPLLIDKDKNFNLYESIRPYCTGEIPRVEFDRLPKDPCELS
jgi:hypothetical protein